MMNDNNGKKRPLTYYYMLMLVLIGRLYNQLEQKIK